MKKQKDLGINKLAKNTVDTVKRENIKTINALKKLGKRYCKKGVE